MMKKTTLISPHKVELQRMLCSNWSDHVHAWKKSLICTCCFLFDHSDCQSERPEGQMGTLMENMMLFSATLLQKLYSGTFFGDAEILLNFLADQIGVVRRTHWETHTYSSRHAPHIDTWFGKFVFALNLKPAKSVIICKLKLRVILNSKLWKSTHRLLLFHFSLRLTYNRYAAFSI